MTQTCNDPVILNEWHPLTSVDEITQGLVHDTVLLELALSYAMDGDGALHVWHRTPKLPAHAPFDPVKAGNALPTRYEHGYLWACVGNPPEVLFAVPEMQESDRQNVPTGVFGVNVSAGRTIENFLDMGHFPFIHTGILGEETAY